MKVVFVSNFMNHYQIGVSDALYRLSCGNYFFIEITKCPALLQKSNGFIEYQRNYIIRVWESENNKEKALCLAREADVVIASNGGEYIPYIKDRLKQNKLTFNYSERPLKKGWLNFFSPTNLVMQYYYHLFFFNKPYYELCASAYAANDMYQMHSFKGRCYKYGYFPIIKKFDTNDNGKQIESGHIKMIWCARFIHFKHPELTVKLCKELKNRGYDFELNMVGTGKLWERINRLIKRENLSDCIHLLGAMSNESVLKMMSEHDIFLFTSDRNEGWGVVLNEAMGQSCCPVASDMIGSTPYLIEHKQNGMKFESGNLQSLVDSVTYLIDNPAERVAMSKSAYQTISNMWSPENVATRLYNLMASFLSGNPVTYSDGPLSLAVPI